MQIYSFLGVDSPNNPQIAFHVSMSNGYKDFPVNSMVRYDLEHLDLGDGYNAGLYIAPKTGVYVLTWTTFVERGTDYYITRLVVNDRPVGYQMVQCYDDEDVTSTQLVVQQLDAGDHVGIKVHQRRGSIFSSTGWGTSTFSGWLLQ